MGRLKLTARHLPGMASVHAAIRASIEGKRGSFDFPTVDDGVIGMVFLETAVRSAKSNAKWVKFAAI